MNVENLDRLGGVLIALCVILIYCWHSRKSKCTKTPAPSAVLVAPSVGTVGAQTTTTAAPAVTTQNYSTEPVLEGLSAAPTSIHGIENKITNKVNAQHDYVNSKWLTDSQIGNTVLTEIPTQLSMKDTSYNTTHNEVITPSLNAPISYARNNSLSSDILLLTDSRIA